MRWDMFLAPSLKAEDPRGKAPMTSLRFHKIPFSFKLAESASSTYKESKGKNRKQRRIFLCCSYISSPDAQGPRSHGREDVYVCLNIKMQKCSSGQD